MGLLTVKDLASSTMTVFGIKWFLSAQLVLDSPAMTVCLVKNLEFLSIFGGVLVVDLVRLSEFPFVFLAFEIGGARISGAGRSGLLRAGGCHDSSDDEWWVKSECGMKTRLLSNSNGFGI